MSKGIRLNQQDLSRINLGGEQFSPESTNPEIRIIRRVNWNTIDQIEWNDFLNDFGWRNRNKGSALALGSLAISMVDAQTMSKMFHKKYDRSRPSQIKRSMRSFARGFNEFVKESEKGQRYAEFERIHSAYSEPGGIVSFDGARGRLIGTHDDDTYKQKLEYADLELIHDDALYEIEEQSSQGAKWCPGDYEVRGIDLYGSTKVGLDLSVNDSLLEEWHGIKAYIGSQGLETSVMSYDRTRPNSRFSPHITFFSAFSHVGPDYTWLKSLPDTIPLDKPWIDDPLN